MRLEAHAQLDLRLTLFDRVVSLAEEGFDLGVRLGALPDSALRARLVGHVRSVICSSNTAQAAIEAALAGVGLVRALSYQVDSLLADKRLRVVLESFEPEPVPAHLVHLPGPQSRAAAAFLEFAAERRRKRLSSRAARLERTGTAGREGSTRGARDSGAPGIAHGRCERGVEAQAATAKRARPLPTQLRA